MTIVSAETPEDRELARQLGELAKLETILADMELGLASFSTELQVFEGRYARIVGVHLAELDEVEAAIAERRLHRRPDDSVAQAEVMRARARARESAQHMTAAAGNQSREPDEALKTLYREAARRVHPDLAADAASRAVRTDWMARVNRAYEAGDADALRTLMRDWVARPESAPGESVGAQLIRAIRKIDQVQKRLAAIAQELETLQSSEVSQLMERVQESEARGEDLLAGMAERVLRKIAAARKTLATQAAEAT